MQAPYIECLCLRCGVGVHFTEKDFPRDVPLDDLPEMRGCTMCGGYLMITRVDGTPVSRVVRYACGVRC